MPFGSIGALALLSTFAIFDCFASKIAWSRHSSSEGAAWLCSRLSLSLPCFSRMRVMGKLSTFWAKYNIFKHWPPLVQAYRQNASGMEASLSQKRYLKWGSLIPVILFAIGWFLYYLPYFKHQADISFFAYTGNFVQPFSMAHPRLVSVNSFGVSYPSSISIHP